MGIQNIVIHLT